MDIYRQELLDHYHHPRGWGLEGSAPYSMTTHNQTCGDILSVQLWVDNGKIHTMRFNGHGCAISIAATSLVIDHMAGKTTDELLRVGLSMIETWIGGTISPSRISCALLGILAMQSLAKSSLKK